MSDLYGQMQADPGLFAYLNQYQQPQRRMPMPSEGDNYGYASAPPWGMPETHGVKIAADGVMSAALGLGGILAAGTHPAFAIPAIPALVKAGKYAYDARQGYLARSGRDSYSRQVDDNLALMRGQR